VELRSGGRGTFYSGGGGGGGDHSAWPVKDMDVCDGKQTSYDACHQPECQDEVAVNCMWGPWSSYSDCDCTSLQQRHRSIAQSNNPFGTPCEGPTVETTECPSPCQKVFPHCDFHEWSHWSDCDEDGGNQKYRERALSKADNHRYDSGHGCEGATRETMDCPVRKVEANGENGLIGVSAASLATEAKARGIEALSENPRMAEKV
jgi:hypothetical protein